MIAIALSLGHNSSAALIKDGIILVAYEEERLSGIKSDSAFPSLSIREIGKYYDLSRVEYACVSHWEPFADIKGMSAKHWDVAEFSCLLPNATLLTHDSSFSHHDAHMWAAKAYSNLDEFTIVADGFGTMNEVISVYLKDDLVHRVHGYSKSLGLLYQYATAYLGLRMNQDEYKLLGYESHISDLNVGALSALSEESSKFVRRYVRSTLTKTLEPKFDAICNVSALPEFRDKLTKDFDKVISAVSKHQELDEFYTRAVIAHLVQTTVEQSIIMLVDNYEMKKVTLTGGLFYNVKLNNAVMRHVDEICAMPLAGDQSGGLGVYNFNFGDLIIDDLCLGIRPDLSRLAAIDFRKLIYTNTELALTQIRQALLDGKIVNVVRGNMEFGPRALGNTSTIMAPTTANADYVNKMNGRSTVMPMAPIVTSLHFFEDYKKVHRSLSHMIITLDYDPIWAPRVLGAAHKYPFQDKYSGRPQLIDESHWLYPIVDEFEILVNTSFNKHGVPIPLNAEQILDSFFYQLDNDDEDRMVTFVVEDDIRD
jgi:predicted NodU family carbamoyl transferase